MDTPVDEAWLQGYIQRLKIAESKREHALRLQTDYRVFLSYSHSDHGVAEQIVELLGRKQIRYFLDEKSLAWGDRIGDEVQQGMEQCTADRHPADGPFRLL